MQYLLVVMSTSWNRSRYAAFVVDVDGVMTRGAEAIPAAAEALGILQRQARTVLLTNNSTRSRSQLALHLSSLGFSVPADDILPTSFLAARYVMNHCGASAVWILGEEGLREEFVGAGHRLAETPEAAEWVIAGMDRHLNYTKLQWALRALLSGARLLASNEDATYPMPDGLVPGAGAVVGALRGMGFSPVATIGKPSREAFEIALGVLDLPADRVLMIGDRLDTDINGANRAGLDAALVLTGVNTEDDVAATGIYPRWIAESLSDLAAGAARPVEPGTPSPGSWERG